ncbi:hypothetical protein HHK36_023278 [Tetracentron sinense]|uniref:SAC9 second GBDL domain-containing protein n=1 Tax=Tetracentron sinense TaxID=13715 RepID=A0A835D536_TETSI|nr:hypothetical protein HHK36_023278 [Tetracentron sinense]
MNTNLVEKLMGTIYESNPKDQLSRVAVLTLFVATVSIFLFIWSFKKSRKGRVQLPPGPRGLPIIGYVPFLDSDLHRSFAELAKIYGPIMKLQIGSKLSVVLSSASLAKEVLRDQDITFANRDPPIAASTIANGGADIAWSPYGPTWRMLRKYYHEMLHSSSLVCSARRRDVVEKAVREVYNKNGTPINIAELSFLTIFEVVISMLWGDTGEESDIKGEFYEMAEKLVELMDKSNISDLYPILAPFDIQGVEGEMKKLMQRFDHIFDPIIDQRLKLKGERIPNKKGNKDFLQFLLEREEQEDNENPMTRTEIKALIMERKLNFIEARKLEIECLRLNLSAAERDRALLSIGTDRATINPNGLLVDSYMGRLCRLANTLALLGQAALEDKVTAAIGLGTVDDDDVIDFWNITGIGETCSGGYNSRELASSNGLSSHSGSSHGSQSNGFFTNRSVTLDGVICTSCGPEIVLDALILDYVRVLISLRRSACADSAAHKALDQVIGFPSRDSLTEINRTSDSQQTVEILRKLFNGEESLAEFPFASLLHSVETATGSASSLSLLAPFDSKSQHSYWRAPPSTSCVEFAIALGCLSDVFGVILLVSPCGYSMADTPTVHI